MYAKKFRQNRSGRQLLTIFAGDVIMSGLKGKRVGDSSQWKRISKNHRQEGEQVAESEIVPNRHIFVSIFGGETKEKVDKYNKSGYFSSAITYFKILIYMQRKWIAKNCQQEVEHVAESGIFPNWHVFIYIFGWEIKEMVENTVLWRVSCNKCMCYS